MYVEIKYLDYINIWLFLCQIEEALYDEAAKMFDFVIYLEVCWKPWIDAKVSMIFWTPTNLF